MKEYAKKVAVTLLIIIAFILIPLLTYYLLPYFAPFILALLTALLLEPFNQKLMKYLKINRTLASNVSYFVFLGVALFLSYFLIAKIVTEAFELIKFIQRNLPNIQVWIIDFLQQINDFILVFPPEIGLQINQTFTGFVNQLSNLNLISSLGAQTLLITASIPNFFFTLLIFFIALYMINLNLSQINQRFFSYFKEKSKPKAIAVLSDLRNATVGFLKAQVILSTFTYIVSLGGLIFLDVRYALVLAFLIVIVDILPILGTGSVLVPWGLFWITQGDIFRGIGLVLLFIIITVLRKIVEPKILGERIGLGPLATLISIWIGFKVMGILGVFMAPLLIIFYRALVKANVIRYRFQI
ncbi:sporulation integral membrane protein YtvI [Desulfitobacterium dichloroeliminans LMG P-21439]|uniref:Sporulation integral membrane protein YtvI n=1 Tax=Desulfitobacterium dichloroeliminans (strain LMG P-21439 / DCA1) TaxID=871963 RepID=L0F8U8_DESDL|nr:sporulation integral membrane protein YtvI [Desulfitobacterium dichloroeliminans]AGA69455.1 sporulation integral membrane protein YtvI [Desulfitobacterium dichloroeliminans LMG P-21439]